MAYVSCEIPSRRLSRTEPNTIDAIHVELLISEQKWLLMANYRPPSQSPKSYTENAVKALDSAFTNFENVILLGDLNFNIHPFLSAYRKGYSYQSTLLALTEDWRQSLDGAHFVGAILMDLSKAFDCLPHRLLLCTVSNISIIILSYPST